MNVMLKHKVIGLALVAALLPVVVMSGLIYQQKRQIRTTVESQMETLIQDNSEQSAKDVYTMCESTNALVQDQINSKLCVARMLLNQKGGLKFDAEKVRWTAQSQVNQAELTVELPKVMLGGEWLGQNVEFSVKVPLVDEAHDLLACTCTLFQRMNKQGDMLRVATSLPTRNGKRALGTFIPARNPDQTPSPVIAAVLKGDTYRGPAYILGESYLTAYEPLLDADNNVVGMLYVGVKQDSVVSVQDAIRDIKIGKTGYVFVIGTKGEHKGRYVVAKRDSQCDGKEVNEYTDVRDGRPVVREILARALQLPKGSHGHDAYDCQFPGEAAPRKKLVAFTYFEPWDWVIVAGAYLDDYEEMWNTVEGSLHRLMLFSVGAGLGLLALMATAAFVFGSRIANPISRITTVAKTIASGDLQAAAKSLQALTAPANSGVQDAAPRGLFGAADETGQLLAAIGTMTGSLVSLVSQVQYSGIQVTTSATEIAASAKELEATTAEQAASTNQVVASAREISATSQHLASTMEQISGLASGTATLAAAGQEQLGTMEGTMRELGDATGVISARLSAINEKASNISHVVTTINKVADQTNLLSLNAAIEAEKAGEYGRGFSVVAREIRRLADQAAVATLEIEEMVKEMQTAVSAGVMEMDKFNAQVRQSAAGVVQISTQQTQIIEQVQSLLPQFGTVNEGMHQQSLSARQISEAMVQLNEAAHQTAAALSEFNKVTEQLNAASHALQEEVSRFKVNA